MYYFFIIMSSGLGLVLGLAWIGVGAKLFGARRHTATEVRELHQ